eukprot:COSAG01_NODE_20745_length_937_cov_2.646778_1_plen_197_part_00
MFCWDGGTLCLLDDGALPTGDCHPVSGAATGLWRRHQARLVALLRGRARLGALTLAYPHTPPLTTVAAATEPEPDQELGAQMELEPELQPEPEPEPEAERALEQEPELQLESSALDTESGALDTAAVLARMTQVVAAAKMMPATPAPFALKTSRRPPFSPVMDEPSPPRCAVRSDDTKIFDRGKRRGTHTQTQPVS